MLIPVVSAPQLLEGTRYRVIRRLGVGSSADVFLVELAEIGRKFVAKVLHERHSDDPEYVARLRREARALGRLRHPNIVSVTDFAVTASGRPLIVMEYLNGNTLAEELLARDRLPLDEALEYTRQALSALSAAHELGIVHRDLKPQNLLLHRMPGYEPVLKVLDFGAARNLATVANTFPSGLMTNTGTVIGSVHYLSPEGRAGKRVDSRADIYSMALVFCMMVTGRLPADAKGLMPAEVTSAALDLGSVIRDGARHTRIESCLLRALATDPEQRFPNAHEFSQALATAAG
jgi:serine/threonine protein kinase